MLKIYRSSAAIRFTLLWSSTPSPPGSSPGLARPYHQVDSQGGPNPWTWEIKGTCMANFGRASWKRPYRFPRFPLYLAPIDWVLPCTFSVRISSRVLAWKPQLHITIVVMLMKRNREYCVCTSLVGCVPILTLGRAFSLEEARNYYDIGRCRGTSIH